MSVVVPFKALRPRGRFVRQVASLPYDVVSLEEAKSIASGNPLSFLHVEKSEIDLPAGTPPHDERIYAAAKRNLEGMIRDGVLVQDEKACFYLYAQGLNGIRQYGIVGGISVSEYEGGTVKRHELTRADQEMDRLRHVDRVNAHTGPVFVTYPARPSIDRVVAAVAASVPECDFVADDGISHTVWVIDSGETIRILMKEFARVERLYIADGHHRAAAAAAVARMRRNQCREDVSGEYESMLAVLVPDTQIRIMDYNRVVKDLNGLTPDVFVERCRKDFLLSPAGKGTLPQKRHEFGMYLDGRWYSLVAKEGVYDPSDPVGRLDVSILQERILGPLLAVHDPRANQRISFVGGIRGKEALEKLVSSGAYSVAFALYPVTIEQLVAVADSGMIMPPKSTWFEPKLRSGIFTHLL